MDNSSRRHQIIFINGPRHSGKDTAGRIIMKEWFNCRHRKFAGPLKAACAAAFGIEERLLHDLEAEGSMLKLEPRPEFFGMSWVDALIWFSEECMKPKFGNEVFGRLMVHELQKPTGAPFTIITDSGFATEAFPVVRAFGVQNCHVFRLYREGKTFVGDSRGYLLEHDLPDSLHFVDIQNVHEMKMFRIQVLRRVDQIMGREMQYDPAN
jgi:hypothetical protein